MVDNRDWEKDCYFFINIEVPEEEQHMSVLCVKCHDERMQVGWFYRGSKEGYGPFVYKCELCDRVIQQPEEEHEQKEEN